MTTNNGFPGELPENESGPSEKGFPGEFPPSDQPSGPVGPPPGLELPETQKPAGPFMVMPPEAPKAGPPPMELPPSAPASEPEPAPAVAPKVSPLQRYSDALGNPYARDEDDEFPGQSGKTENPGYSGLAIGSLVASLLCCGFIGLPLGVIALIVNRDGEKKGKGLAIAGVLIGLIGLLVILVGGYTLLDKGMTVAKESCSVETPTAEEQQLCQAWKDFEEAKAPGNPAVQ